MSGSWRKMLVKVKDGSSGKYEAVEKVKKLVKNGDFKPPDLTPEMIEEWSKMTVTACQDGWETKHRCVQLSVILKEKGYYDAKQLKRVTDICNASVDKSWETSDDCEKFLNAKRGGSGGERVVWMKFSAKELMSKGVHGTMEFNQKVSIGCTTDMKIAAKVYGEASAKAPYGVAECSVKAGFEVSSSFQMTNSKASETTKKFTMPDGSPGYVYQMCVEVKTNTGKHCSWNCNVKMTDKPLHAMIVEKNFDGK